LIETFSPATATGDEVRAGFEQVDAEEDGKGHDVADLGRRALRRVLGLTGVEHERQAQAFENRLAQEAVAPAVRPLQRPTQVVRLDPADADLHFLPVRRVHDDASHLLR